MNRCFTTEELARYLAAPDFSETEATEVEDHVSSCPTCSAAFTELTARQADPAQALATPTDPLSAPAFLERLKRDGPPAPLDESPPDAEMAAPPGYELLERLGKGGMAIVYRARDLRLNRFVALKVIQHSNSDDQPLRWRFEAETIAGLSDPGIVPIFEVGEHRGFPFLCLELCSGGSLAARLNNTPQSPTVAARVLAQLALAVHHAHSKGIIHRDLKPANVLLVEDADTPLEACRVKVTDFGMAKRLDVSGELTKSGAVLGTPSYMPPEQARSRPEELGPRTDVYALGAVLYEMLTGRPPFRGESDLDTLLLVIAQEPVPPTSLQPKVPRDLETICLKCLEKEPSRRYESAQALTDDLKRFLEGKPIKARPIGTVERLWRWCRRNPAAAAAIATVMGSLVAIAIVSTTAAVRIDAHRQAAENARTDADIAREVSEKDAEHARRALKMAADTNDTVVIKITENEKLRDRGFFELRKELLSAVLSHYEELIALRTEDPELEAARARAYGKMGTIRMYLGENDQTVDAWRKSESTFASLIARHPNVPSYQLAAAVSYDELAVLFAERDHKDQAKAALDRGDEIAETLVRDHPETADYHAIRIRLRLNRRLVEVRDEDAMRIVSEAEQFAREAVDRFPNHVECRTLLGLMYGVRGEYLRELRRFADAEQSDREALKVLQPFGEMPSSPQFYRYWLGYAWFGLGTDLGFQHRYEEARQAHEKALSLLQPLCKEEPGIISFRKALAKTYFNLAQAKDGIGDSSGATGLRRQSLETFEELAAGFPSDSDHTVSLGINYLGAGSAEFRQGKYDNALNWFTKATAILEQVSTHNPLPPLVQQDLANAHAQRGASLYLLKRYVDAVAAFDRAIALDNGEHREEWTNRRKFTIQAIRQEMLPALSMARSGNYVRAAATTSMLVKGTNAHPELYYNAVCVYAICADKVKDKDTNAAQEYAAEAIALLKRANAEGLFKDPQLLKYLRTDKDLNPLRERSDFKQIVVDATGNRP